MSENIYPSAPEAERAILGAVLLDPLSIHVAIDLIKAEDFYRDAHRVIYESMVKLSADGRALDVVTIGDHLATRGEINRVGGFAELGQLAQETGTAVNIESHCRLVAEKSRLRRLLTATERIRQDVLGATLPPDEIVDKAEREIFEISQRTDAREPKPVSGLLDEAFNHIDQLRLLKGKMTGITTGLLDLDEITSGFQKSDLFILAGRPSMGKSTLAMNMMEAAAVEAKVSVVFFSMEMPVKSVVMRFLAALARISYKRISTGRLSADEYEQLGYAAHKLEKTKLFIDDSSSLTPMEVRSRCRRLIARYGPVGLVCVDYLQLMNASRRFDNRVQEVSDISRNLKAVARELDVPLLVLSQLSRATAHRTDHRPQLSDLRDSGAIEQDADIVAFIHREDYAGTGGAGDGGEAELLIQKHRNGETGVVKLAFIPQKMRFENAARADDFGSEDADTAVVG